MALLKVTFIINDNSFDHDIPLPVIRKSGMINNILDDTGIPEGDDRMPIVLSGLNIQEKYHAKVVSLIIDLLTYLTTDGGDTFTKETIEVSNDYENEDIDKMFSGLAFAYYSHVINVANFLDVPSVFKYLVAKFAKLVRDRIRAKKDGSN